MFWVLIFFAKIVFLQSNIQTFAGYAVAPYVGAWIETIRHTSSRHLAESHPMWVRGLKRANSGMYQNQAESHPMWVRGLKLPVGRCRRQSVRVAPYVGAWIETSTLSRTSMISSVAPYVGAWIETKN